MPYTIPSPSDPKDWQNAYSQDQAFSDSDQYGNKYALPAVFLGFFLIGFYFFIIAIQVVGFFEKSFTSRLWIGLFIFILPIALLGAAYLAASRFASGFLSEYYQPPDGTKADELIYYRVFGVPKFPPPISMFVKFQSVTIKDGAIDKPDSWPSWMARKLGGPLKLKINDGNALYLERGNRFSRVVGPISNGAFLEWFETIKYVVDLRPQIKEGDIDAWTKDGIKISLTVRVEFRVGDPLKKDPAGQLLYPFDPLAIKKAVERVAVAWPDRQNGQPSETDWIGAAWGQNSIIKAYIGSRTLDDLLEAGRQSGQILSADALKDILNKFNDATQGFGIYVTDLQILKVKMPDEVETLIKEYWKAERHSIVLRTEGETKAAAIRSREKARAEAQRDLIVAIADGLGSYKDRDGQFSEPLLLSLSGILDQSLDDPLMRAYLAKETLETLQTLQDILKKKDNTD